MTINITNKEHDIPSEHLLLTDSVANHLMMVQTGTDMQKIELACFAKKTQTQTLPFVVWQSKR